MFKKIFNSKLSLVIISFLLGYFTNVLLVRYNNNHLINMADDRIPVSPEDFDAHHLIGKGFVDQMKEDVNVDDFDITPKRSEDRKNVYYEIPLSHHGKNSKIKVDIKDGQIHIQLNSDGEGMSAQSEQVFSIDEGLNENKADVKTLEDKIIITIPKK